MLPMRRNERDAERSKLHDIIGQWRMVQEISAQEPRPIAGHRGRRDGEPKMTDKLDTVACGKVRKGKESDRRTSAESEVSSRKWTRSTCALSESWK